MNISTTVLRKGTVLFFSYAEYLLRVAPPLSLARPPQLPQIYAAYPPPPEPSPPPPPPFRLSISHSSVLRRPQAVPKDEPIALPLLSTHTLSARVLARREEAAAASAAAAGERGYSSITLHIKACGLGPADIMGRGASVFVEAAPAVVAGTGGFEVGEGGLRDGDRLKGRGSGFQHFWGVLPTFPPPAGRRGRAGGEGVETLMGLVDREHPRSLAVTARTSENNENWLQGNGQEELEVEQAVVRVIEGVEGRGGSQELPGGRRRLAEDCSGSCLRSSTQRCFNDPACDSGGLGCNALNDQLCRFCGFSDFVECGTGLGPTPAPVPTPAPTSPPDRQVCSSSCLQATYFTCFDDSSCRIGGLGCNARGDFFCRFCGFGEFIACPDGVGVTVVPTPAPSYALTVAPSLTTTIAPTLATIAPTLATLTPTLATLTPTLAPLFSLAPSLVPTLAPSLVPTMAPASIAPTLVPSPAPTTMAPVSLAPTLAPTVVPTAVVAGPTMAPSSAPTAPTRDAGELGPSSVKGVISIIGVSDELVEEKGQTAIIQEVRGVGLSFHGSPGRERVDGRGGRRKFECVVFYQVHVNHTSPVVGGCVLRFYCIVFFFRSSHVRYGGRDRWSAVLHSSLYHTWLHGTM